MPGAAHGRWPDRLRSRGDRAVARLPEVDEEHPGVVVPPGWFLRSARGTRARLEGLEGVGELRGVGALDGLGGLADVPRAVRPSAVLGALGDQRLWRRLRLDADDHAVALGH